VSKSKKVNFVNQFAEIYKESGAMMITHYHGLTVSQITTLRNKLRENNSGFKVVKNTLSKIALHQVGCDIANDLFFGPTGVAYSSDPVAVAKSVVDFAKENEKLVLIGGIIHGQLLTVDEVKELAKLPSLDVLRAQFISLLQTPATRLATVLQAPASSLARVLSAYSKK
jgi:large subunit ribosomal protein L10